MTAPTRVFNSPLWQYDPAPALAAAAQAPGSSRGGGAPPRQFLPHHPETWKVSIWQARLWALGSLGPGCRRVHMLPRALPPPAAEPAPPDQLPALLLPAHPPHPPLVPLDQVDNRLGTFIAVRAFAPPPQGLPRTVLCIEEKAQEKAAGRQQAQPAG